MKRARKTPRPPRDAKAFPAASALPEHGEQPIVRRDERAAVRADDDRVALSANAGIHDRQENAAARILGRERGEQVRCRLDAEVRRIVQRVYYGDFRRERAQDCLDLPDVEVVRPEVGEKDDQAAFFASGFADSGASGRSISVTSASGALSPLRKPFFRILR